jgi:galactokinase
MLKIFVPGRICLFGEHSDWAGQMRKFNSDIRPGRALVVCTEQGIYANAECSEKLVITTFDTDGKEISAEYNSSFAYQKYLLHLGKSIFTDKVK